MTDRNRILASIFLASFSTLSFEITLLRVFSVSLWYHFAFMVISIAMVGIGASGTLLSLYPVLKDIKHLPSYSLILGTGITASYILTNMIPFDPARFAWEGVQILYIGGYCLLLSIPFLSIGLIIGTSFSALRRHTGVIYASDLTGAGAGSLFALFLLYTGGPERAVFVVSIIALLSILLYNQRRTVYVAILIMAANLLLLIVSPHWITPRLSQYKPLQVALRYPGAEHLKTYHSPYARIDIFKSPAVRYAPGLSFKYLERLPEQRGITIDADEMDAITYYKDRSKLEFIRYLPSALAYELAQKKDVVVLDPRGGLDLLIADYYGTGNLYKVDSNSLVIGAVRDFMDGLTTVSPRLTDLYSKNRWAGLGRNWLRASDGEFDLIAISLTGSMPKGSFGFSEDYRFTVEAFEEYIRKLKPEGFLSINLFMIPPPRIELRLLTTISEAIKRLGVKEISGHIAAIRSWGTVNIILKRSPLSASDIDIIKRFTGTRGFDLIYYPGVREDVTNIYIRMKTDDYFNAFKSLIDPDIREAFIRDYLFDISPVYDGRPFFHYYLKITNIKETFRVMGEKWQYFIEEGYLLPFIFIQVLILGAAMILLPLKKLKRAEGVRLSALSSPLIYFGLLGTGYMFVEVTLIQRMILPLENPSYAAAAVISSILISSGAGSLLSQRFESFRRPLPLLILSVTIFIYSLILPELAGTLTYFPMEGRTVIVFFVLIPLGLLMGIPFPSGLYITGIKFPALIPWAWAINGCFSVLSPVLAIMLALSAGFKVVFISGGVIYLLSFYSLRSLYKE